MKKLILLFPLLLTACITPDARKFPDIPPELKQACPDLQEIDPKTTKLSVVVDTICWS